jgi:ribosomal protein S27E
MTTMANNGGYHIPCPCGHLQRSAEPIVSCEGCGRILDVTGWGGEPVVVKGKNK